jgi:hypothetical protein
MGWVENAGSGLFFRSSLREIRPWWEEVFFKNFTKERCFKDEFLCYLGLGESPEIMAGFSKS